MKNDAGWADKLCADDPHITIDAKKKRKFDPVYVQHGGEKDNSVDTALHRHAEQIARQLQERGGKLWMRSTW